MRKILVNHRGGGTVILPTEEPTVQQTNQSTAAPDETGKETPASPGAAVEASAEPTATPTESATPSTSTPLTEGTDETADPEATSTPEASADPSADPTADPSASPSLAPVLKAPMMAPAVTATATLEKGEAFNLTIKNLAGYTPTIYPYDTTVKTFSRSSSAPAPGATTADISASQDGSIVAWFDGSTGTVYWYSTANKIMLNVDSSMMFFHMGAIERIDAGDFDTSNVTDMNDMFSGCNNLTSLDVSKWNVGKVENMSWMFWNCRKLALDVTSWDVSNVTNMSYMFLNCSSFTSLGVSKWNVSKVTNMNSMFFGCNNLTSLDVSDWDTSSVTDMNYMFYDCGKLATFSVSKWAVSEVTTMDCMFYHCQSLTSLDVTNWDTHNVTELGGMFQGCNNLASLDVTNWDTSNVRSTAVMFQGCKNLTTIDVSNWDVSKVTSMWDMFDGCKSLTTIDLSNWDTGSVESMDELFKGCSGLKTMVFGPKFVVLPPSEKEIVFSTPLTTVSGVKSNGKWGLGSETTSPSYDAAGLRDLGKTAGALTGTWYAQTDENVATITFDTNGGDPLPVASKFVMIGDEYGDLPTPTRAGYSFSGWYTAASGGTQVTSVTVCTGSTTIYAGWEWDSSTYTIKFDINYRDAVGAPENMLVKFGSSIPQPDTSKMKNFDGLRLDGWYLEPACRREFTSFGDQLDKKIVDEYFGTGTTLTLYAGWWTKYKLTFNPDGGTWLDDSSTADREITSENNVPYNIPFNLEKFGYTLDHWGDVFQKTYKDGDQYTGIEGGGYIDDEMTAVWKPNVYAVNFNANSGSNAPASQTDLAFEKDAVTSPDIKGMARQGYTFNGWYLDAACTKPFNSFGVIINRQMVEDDFGTGSAMTLYAGWKAAPEPTPTPSATPSTSTNNNRGAVASTSHSGMFFPITSAQKFIPATGAAGENNN